MTNTQLLTQQDIADRMGIVLSTVQQMHRDQKWPHVKAGRRIRYTEGQWDEILRRNSVTPAKVKQLPGQTARSAKAAS